MLVRLFKNISPSAYILLPALALFMWINGFFTAISVSEFSKAPLYDLMALPLNFAPIIGVLLGFVLLIIEAFLLNLIVVENEILKTQSYLSALCYIILMSYDNSILHLHPILIANLFVLLGLRKLISSYRMERAFSNTFDAGVYFAIATLFSYQSLLLLPILLVGLYMFRPIIWREWAITVIGILLIYFVLGSVYFLTNNLHVLLSNEFVSWTKPLLVTYPSSLAFFMGYVIVLLIMAITKLPASIRGASQKNIKGLYLFVWMLLLATLSLTITPELSPPIMAIFSIPIAILFSNYFTISKTNWLNESLFLLLTLAAFANLISNYF